MNKEILVYRYRSICEPDVIEAFRNQGYTVIEDMSIIECENKPAETINRISRLIDSYNFHFIFSINFFPLISEICEIYKLRYVCWTVDVPVLELFSPAIRNSCNRIFLFDYTQYEYFRNQNPDNIFYMPLATGINRWDRVIGNASVKDRKRYASDISFVGSLYSEKNDYKKIQGLSDYSKGYIQGLVEAQLNVYGVNFIEEMLTDRIMEEMAELVPDMHTPLCKDNEAARRYLIAHCFIGYDIAEKERYRLLGALSELYDVDLYTFSGADVLPKVHAHSPVNSQTEMPLVFHESRINLNITMRPIATGLSLRVYDVCGCGGFLLTNWQEELPVLYEPGVEVETFSSQEELLDKAAYYLKHEDERQAIARRGYERTKAEHTFDRRIKDMLRIIM